MPIASPKDMERIILAKRVGKFLNSQHRIEDREAVITIARKLASDISQQVREVLAFELRVSSDLPADIAEKIACDVENVASPFLEHTQSLSTEQMIKLLPRLHKNAHITLAKRSDLSPGLAHAIVTYSDEPAVTYVVRNIHVELQEKTSKKIVSRFKSNTSLMDFLSKRGDLPLSVVKEIIDIISENCRQELVENYDVDMSIAQKITKQTSIGALWDRVNDATSQQIHGLVTDLKVEDKLNHKLVMEMAERGSRPFLESTLALYSGLTLAEVKKILTLDDAASFVNLLKQCEINSTMAPKYLAAVKKLNTLFPESN